MLQVLLPLLSLPLNCQPMAAAARHLQPPRLGLSPSISFSLCLYTNLARPALPACRSLEVDGKPATLARAGDSADVTLSGIDASAVCSGTVLCHPDFPVPLADK